MADIRPRATSTTEEVILPTQQIEQTNQYDSILQRLQELETQNKELTKKVAEANGDISEKIKGSKRKYGYNIDGTRNLDEPFKYKYSVLIDERKEKVVISTQTIGRPVNIHNSNTGKWTNIHNIEVVFHDGTKTEMDVLDYINQKYLVEEIVKDSDIKVIGGVKNYTFHTEKFGKFTIGEKFIN